MNVTTEPHTFHGLYANSKRTTRQRLSHEDKEILFNYVIDQDLDDMARNYLEEEIFKVDYKFMVSVLNLASNPSEAIVWFNKLFKLLLEDIEDTKEEMEFNTGDTIPVTLDIEKIKKDLLIETIDKIIELYTNLLTIPKLNIMKIEEPLVLYSGRKSHDPFAHYKEPMRPGYEFQPYISPTFISTTLNPNAAMKFINTMAERGTLMQITVPLDKFDVFPYSYLGYGGKTLQKMIEANAEEEVLLPPNTILKYTGNMDNNIVYKKYDTQTDSLIDHELPVTIYYFEFGGFTGQTPLDLKSNLYDVFSLDKRGQELRAYGSKGGKITKKKSKRNSKSKKSCKSKRKCKSKSKRTCKSKRKCKRF